MLFTLLLIGGGDALTPLTTPGLLYRDATGLKSLQDDSELESEKEKQACLIKGGIQMDKNIGKMTNDIHN